MQNEQGARLTAPCQFHVTAPSSVAARSVVHWPAQVSPITLQFPEGSASSEQDIY